MTTFTVTSYGSGDILRLVFNAVASVFGHSDYVVAMNIAALMGFIAVMMRCALDRHTLQNLRWFIALVVFYMAVIVPKTTVIIEDKLIPADTAVVDNVPIGLAATAGIFSQFGDWLTRAFETAFSLPGNAQYSANGMMFPNRVLAALQTAALPEGETQRNFTEFFKSCVVLDGIGHGRFTWDELRKTPDLARFFSERTARHVAYFAYRKGNYSDILPCRSGFRDHLNSDLNDLEEELLAGTSVPLVGTLKNLGQTYDRLKNEMASTVAYITGERRTRRQLLVQHALINALDQGRMAMAQELGATAVMQAYALSKAELERKTTYQATGKVAEQKLPLIRSLFEAFLYAIFPLVALMAIIIPTRVSFEYVKALVWINLWAPAYALLNFAATYYSSLIMPELADAYNGLSAAAQIPLLNHHADAVATVGYLSMSIPVIAYMLVSRSGAMAATFAGRVMDGYDRSISNAASEAASGDMKLGSEQFRMVQGTQIEQSHYNAHGQHVTSHADGTQTFANPQSRLQLSASSADSIIESTSRAVSKARTVEDQAAMSNAQARLETIDQIQATQDAVRHSATMRDSTGQSHDAGRTLRYGDEQRAIDTISDATGLSTERVKEAMENIRASAGAGGNIGVARAGVDVGVGGSSKTATRDSEAVRLVSEHLSSSGVGTELRESAQHVITTATSQGAEGVHADVDELRKAVRGQQRAESTHAQATRSREQAENRYMRAQQMRKEIATDQGDAFLRFVAENDGNVEFTDKEVAPTTRQAAAQLINKAARGDANSQALLHKFQNAYLDHKPEPQSPEAGSIKAPQQDTVEAQEAKFSHSWAAARAAVDAHQAAALPDVDLSRLRSHATIERNRALIEDTANKREDDVMDVHEVVRQKIADQDIVHDSIEDELDDRVQKKMAQ